MRFRARSTLVLPVIVTQATSTKADEWRGEDVNVAV